MLYNQVFYFFSLFCQVLHTIALLVKRASLESEGGAVFESVFSAVTQLLASDVTRMVRINPVCSEFFP